MLIVIGFVVVAVLVVYKRSQEIIVVNPMRYHQSSSQASETVDFARILNTISDAAKEAERRQSSGGRALIRDMVKNQQFIEAIKKYREIYGVDLRTAKKAVDEMMLEQ